MRYFAFPFFHIKTLKSVHFPLRVDLNVKKSSATILDWIMQISVTIFRKPYILKLIICISETKELAKHSSNIG